MQGRWSTAAWVAHDLGLAAGVGGPLFGRVALHRAVREVEDKSNRGRVVSEAWKSYSPIQLAGLAAMAITWLTGRTMLSGKEATRTARSLTLVKDVLVATTFASGLGSSLLGRQLAAQAPDERVPLESGDEIAPEASEKAKRLQRATSWLGLTSILSGLGVMGVTSALAMQSGKSARWSAVARFLK